MVHKQHQQGRPEANNDQQMAARLPLRQNLIRKAEN